MAFVAYYKMTRLLGLAAIGVLFAGLGIVLAMEPAGSFDHSGKIQIIGLLFGGNNDLAGHVLGWVTMLFGAAVFPVIINQMGHREPALRIDADGIYWHRWSPKPIGWANVARFEQRSVYKQKFVSLWLHNPSRDPGRGLLGKMARANKAIGFGDVSLSIQGTDKSFEELLEAVIVYSARYQLSLRAALNQPVDVVGPILTRRVFGRKQ